MKTTVDTTQLTQRDGEYHVIEYDENGYQIGSWDSWAIFHLLPDGEIYAIEPYADHGYIVEEKHFYKRHFYNRIQGSELDELLENEVTIYFND